MNILPDDDVLVSSEPGTPNSSRMVVRRKLSIAERRAKKIAEGKLCLAADGKFVGSIKIPAGTYAVDETIVVEIELTGDAAA